MVDDEDRPPGHPRVAGDVVPPYPVVADHLALEISDQVEGQAAQLLGESLVGEDRIDADSVDADAVSSSRVMP
jgi:hypothetical protein